MHHAGGSEPGTDQVAQPGRLNATLAFGMLVGMITIGTIGALGPYITQDLGISLARFGSLATAMFLTAAIISPTMGGLVDRVDAKRLLAALLVLISAAIAAMSD